MNDASRAASFHAGSLPLQGEFVGWQVPADTIETTEPEACLAALASDDAMRTFVVDFDETLWLRNSTEMFLDHVRPRFLAAIVLQILGFLKPWRLFGRAQSEHYRDWFRVVGVLAVAPWSLWQWRRNAPRLVDSHINRPLLAAVQADPRKRVLVATFGFREIIAPLLHAIDSRLVLAASCSLRDGASLRREGKAANLAREAGIDLSNSVVVTDSLADDDLLRAGGRPFLVRWPDAHYAQAGLRPMMPFVYLTKVKRPDERYVLRCVFGHDMPILLLAFASVSSQPLVAACAIGVYLVAFFTAYEIGYHENDRLGLLREKQPKVSPQFAELGHNFDPAFAICAAAAIAMIGSLIAAPSVSIFSGRAGVTGLQAALATFGVFLAFLLVMRLLFRWQNLAAPQGRIVPMLGLQIGRVLGYAVIFPTSLAGALLCVAHGISMWVPYVVYRFGGSRKDVPNHLICLLLFGAMEGAALIGGGMADPVLWQTGVIAGYLVFRAAIDIRRFGGRLMPCSELADARR